MERKIYIVAFFLIYTLHLFSQNKKDVYNAHVENKMSRWAKTIEELQSKKLNNDELLSLINYQYGYIAWCIGNKMKDDAGKHLKKAYEQLELAEQNNLDKSTLFAYKSAFYGFSIGLNFAKAPFLGPKSIDFANKAMELDNKNPLGYIQYANAKFYMPETFGGSKYIAVEYYLKAEKLMEQQPGELNENWNYLNLLTTIAKSYESIERYSLAKQYYEKILKSEPRFSWVKDKLYPELLKKMNAEHEK